MLTTLEGPIGHDNEVRIVIHIFLFIVVIEKAPVVTHFVYQAIGVLMVRFYFLDVISFRSGGPIGT